MHLVSTINQPKKLFTPSYTMINRQDNENGYVPSKYSKAFNNYTRNQLKSVVPILRSVAQSCNIAFRYPVYKVLKAVSKIFLMNEIQGIFFAYMIRETNWDIKDKLITENSDKVRDVVCYNSDHPEYKNFILYLLLVTYSLKFFLNEDSQQLMEQAIRICPNFRLIFQNWTKKHSDVTKKICPKTLNKVYQDLYLKMRHQQPDFSLLVDSIIQISPAYNPQKSEKDKKLEKKDFLPRQLPTKMIKLQEDIFNQHNSIFSSRIYEIPGVGLNISEGSNFQAFGQKSGNLGTRFGKSLLGSSSVIGVAGYQVKQEKDDEYCQQLNLGLQQGQSQQNINLKEEIPKAPPTSIIYLNRSISSEKFSSFKISDTKRG